MRARLIVGYGAIACALPYLALKAIWIAGGELGVADTAMMREGSMVALNVATGLMDIVGIAIALTFTHAWGQRVPAWLLLPPAWVAIGLLVRFIVAVPVTVLAGFFTFRSTPPATGGPVHPWVYGLVYSEFVGLGLGLAIAFVLYARVRWPWVFASTLDAHPPGVTHVVQVPSALAAATLAAAVGVVHLAWALGGTVGLPPELVRQRTVSSHILNLIDGAIMLAGAGGIVMLMLRLRDRTRYWKPLAATWIGSGFLFAWGLWGMINVLSNTPLVRERASATTLLNLLLMVQLISGLVIGLMLLVALAERRRSP